MAAFVTTLVIAAIIAAMVLLGTAQHNNLVRLRDLVTESWQHLELELSRRHDLIPGLVEIVRSYAAHESDALLAVTTARRQAMAPTTPAQQAAGEGLLLSSVGKLFMVAEDYPDLKADESFRQLRRDLAQAEHRVAASRRYYQANVRTFNAKADCFPVKLIAKYIGLTSAEYFDAATPRRPTALPNPVKQGATTG